MTESTIEERWRAAFMTRGVKPHTLADGRVVRLGRLKPPPGPRRLLARVFDASKIPAPPVYSWNAHSLALNAEGLGDILDNDTCGCCTIAGAAHILDAERGSSGNHYVPVIAAQVMAEYVAMTGYKPGDDSTDTGCNEVDVLNKWELVGLFGDKIIGWANVDATNTQMLRAATWLFGNLYLGVALPDAWINPGPSRNGFIWDVAGAPNPNNGHCVVGIGYNSKGVLIDTWGLIGTITWRAMARYFDGDAGEAHVVFTNDQLNQASQKAPNGFSLVQLVTYLKSF